MRTNIARRIVIVSAVIALSLWAIYPPQKNIKLGLDLNGGVQLVLRVKTEDTLQRETEATIERLRNALAEAKIAFTSLERTSATEFHVEGIHDTVAFRDFAADVGSAFERVPGDGAPRFRMRPAAAREMAGDTVRQAMHTIDRRVNALGVAEAVVARYTNDDQILVELPGVTNVDQAKQIIKSTVQFRLTVVEQGPFATREEAMRAYGDALPTTLEVLPSSSHTRGTTVSAFYVVQKAPAVSGNDLRDVRQSVDEFNRPAVSFTLKPEAARRFGGFTERHVNRTLATVLDDRVTSLATILSRIDAEGQITGLSREEMIEQVINFKSGALPADLEYEEERTIGASLGAASIRSGVLASLGGLTFIMVFLLGYYRLAGLNAVTTIVLNLLILLGLVAFIPVTMTLPGIAGLILTIGMGVDSNVLIFERIKEELARARNPGAAVKAGFDRVWITIVDTHITSLIAAAFLYQFGTSFIRGFATTLTIGLIANVFTAVFASRLLFDLILRYRTTARWLNISWPKIGSRQLDFNFTRWGIHALGVSLLVIGAGAATMATRGLPLGIDFSGGTLLVVEFTQPGVTEDAVRNAVARLPGDEVVQRYGAADARQFLIRLPLAETAAQSAILESGAREVSEALRAASLPPFDIVDRELVSAAIGEDLQWRAIYATLASIAAITIYIGLRFRFVFAIGGIAATVHDVMVTLACLSLAGYDLSLNVTAALLTVIGYSVNDTIVIFDRVRENVRAMRSEPLSRVVDLSVNQTLSRTLITAGTTLLSVLALYLFGGEALRGFAFTMLVGIVSGTYSTVFIASAIAARLSRTMATGRAERVRLAGITQASSNAVHRHH
jgi:protein-export membrane protein SecD/preprotein translocase SecF subunit